MNDPDIGVWEVAARICPDRSLKILWLRCRLFPRSLDRGPIEASQISATFAERPDFRDR